MYCKNVRVCKEWFPKGTYPRQREDGFLMADILKEQLDILVKNVVKDWDFTIIISGGGEVRVGKSVLAMQIAAYWHYCLWKVHGKKIPFSIKDNMVMDGRKLIEKGNYLGKKYPYSALIFDEAGADLEGRKVMQTVTQDVLDYYRECGQYNMLNILVLPEFFDLPKGVALSRSICLLDVYYSYGEDDIFQRGYFNFYSKRRKKDLYLKGRKELDYNVGKKDFAGTFSDFYPIDEAEYRALKQDALSKRENRKRNKFQIQRDACWYILTREMGITQEQLGKRMEQLTGIFVAHNTISDGVRHYMLEEEILASAKA